MLAKLCYGCAACAPRERGRTNTSGRLSFVCGALTYDCPFLAPLYSLAAASRTGSGRKVDATELPPYVLFSLMHLAERLRSRRTVHCLSGRPNGDDAVERFRTDAKVEGDLVTIGGHRSCDSHRFVAPKFFLSKKSACGVRTGFKKQYN